MITLAPETAEEIIEQINRPTREAIAGAKKPVVESAAQTLVKSIWEVTAEEIFTYDNLCRVLISLEKKRAGLREKFLQARSVGAKIATSGKIQLVFTPVAGHLTVDWQSVAINLAKQHYPKSWETWQKRVIAAAPMSESYLRVTTQLNPDRAQIL